MMIHFLLLVDHSVLIHHVYSFYFLLDVARVVSFRARKKLIKCCLHYVIVIQDIVAFSLVAACQVIESLTVFVFHLFLNTKVCALSGFIFKINIAEIGIINIHFTDCPQ